MFTHPSPASLEPWVKKFYFFHDITKDVLQVLCNNLDVPTFIKTYGNKTEEWWVGAATTPLAMLPPDDCHPQGSVYHNPGTTAFFCWFVMYNTRQRV